MLLGLAMPLRCQGKQVVLHSFTQGAFGHMMSVRVLKLYSLVTILVLILALHIKLLCILYLLVSFSAHLTLQLIRLTLDEFCYFREVARVIGDKLSNMFPSLPTQRCY